MKTETPVPVRRHPDCKDDSCPTCFADHAALAEYIREQSGIRDGLSQYRKWLDDSGIPAEVNGWASHQAFDPNTVRSFIADWMRNNFAP